MTPAATPVVLVEGVDKTGKSSLALRFVYRLRTGAGQPWELRKFSQPKADPPSDEYFAAAVDPTLFVADRFHLGEFVYGPLYRGARPNEARYRLLELLLQARGAVLVIMTDQPAAIAARFQRHDEAFAQVAHVERLVDGFRRMVAWTRLPLRVFQLQPDDDGTLLRAVDDAVAAVVLELNRTPALPPRVWREDETVGYPLAPTLLVGEEVNHRVNRWDVPFHSTAGDYLMEALELAGLHRRVLLTNSRLASGEYYTQDTLARLDHARRALGQTRLPRVVALGRKAAANLRDKGGVTPAATLPHPQWRRRFLHHDLRGYAKLLVEAMREGA